MINQFRNTRGYFGGISSASITGYDVGLVQPLRDQSDASCGRGKRGYSAGQRKKVWLRETATDIRDLLPGDYEIITMYPPRMISYTFLLPPPIR